MTRNSGMQWRGDCLSPTDPGLLQRPLDFIAEDHLREREVCASLDRIAEAAVWDQGDVRLALTFLSEELSLHLQDEEEDLFPLMRRRCDPGDEIGKAIGRLTSDHGHAADETPEIVATLARLEAGGAALTQEERTSMARYAGYARRHLVLENAVILPLARLRLTRGDLETLRIRMMQRRGLERLPETGNAQ